MSGSNCCFLTCIHISQEAGKVVWCSHLLKNFSQFFFDPRSQRLWYSQWSRCFSGTLLLFLMIQWRLAVWSLFPLSFLKPAWTSGSSWFTYYWSLAWRLLSSTLLACEMSATCSTLNTLWHCLSLGLEWKLNLFQSCGHCWVFQICWHIECSTFTASSLRFESPPGSSAHWILQARILE